MKREEVKPNFRPIWNNSVSRESGIAAAATSDFVHPTIMRQSRVLLHEIRKVSKKKMHV